MTAEAEAKVPVLSKITSDKVFCYVSMALLMFLPVAEIITEFLIKAKIKKLRFLYPSYYQPYIVMIFGGIFVLLIVLNLISRAVSGKFKLYLADIFFFTLTAFMLISMFCSVNFGVFADGVLFYSERPETFLCYYGLFFAGSMIVDPNLRKKLLFSYAIIAVIEGILGFLQSFNIEISYCLYAVNRMPNTAYGTLQNTNFYGTLSCVLTAAVSGLFIFSSKLLKSKAAKWGTLALSLLLFYTLLASKARLAWIGMAGMIFMYIVSLIVMRKGAIDKDSLRQITIDFLTLIIGYIAVIIIAIICTPYITSRIEVTAEDLQEKAGSDGFGNGRGRIWRAALNSVRRHWLTGIGLDNLAQAFREMPGWKQGDYVQSKGHCEYIHTLATQGVFALANYLVMLICAGAGAVKTVFTEKDDVKRSLTWIFLGVFIAYAAQATLSSSIMNVAPYFWIIAGLLLPRTKPVSLKKG